MKKLFLTIFVCLIFFIGLGVFGAIRYKARYTPQPIIKQPAPQISIRFIEGWNNKEIANYLEKQGVITKQQFLTDVKNFNTSDYSSSVPKEAAGNLEGFLFPDTYFIPKTAATGTSISEIIIKKALDNFAQKVTPAMQSQAAQNKLTLYKTIILASIIEKETGKNAVTQEQKQHLDTERKIIAGLFYNRLNSGMPLQSDATVNFVTGKNDPAVSLQDTQIDSRYNTYKYNGLPPGPICNPSLSSIMAALYPEKTDYLYFLSDPVTGQAIFAVTYDQHLINKQKYLR